MTTHKNIQAALTYFKMSSFQNMWKGYVNCRARMFLTRGWTRGLIQSRILKTNACLDAMLLYVDHRFPLTKPRSPMASWASHRQWPLSALRGHTGGRGHRSGLAIWALTDIQQEKRIEIPPSQPPLSTNKKWSGLHSLSILHSIICKMGCLFHKAVVKMKRDNIRESVLLDQ